jgi:acyl carrier protein
MTDAPMTVIQRILEQRGHHRPLTATTLLGANGLALDSIAIVEVLIACEEHFGVTVAAELLAGEPLTVGRLAEGVEEAMGQRRAGLPVAPR